MISLTDGSILPRLSGDLEGNEFSVHDLACDTHHN